MDMHLCIHVYVCMHMPMPMYQAFCTYCVAALHVDLDLATCPRAGPVPEDPVHAPWYRWPSKPYKCIGHELRYSATNMIDETGLYFRRGWV